VAPTVDERGVEVIPRRTLSYDTLVIAIGSVANTFGVPGVEEHAYALESAAEADRFHRRLINACIQANYRPVHTPAQLRVVIVGAERPAWSSLPSCATPRASSPDTGSKTSTRNGSSILPSSTPTLESCRCSPSVLPRL